MSLINAHIFLCSFRNFLKIISLYWFYSQVAFRALKLTLQLIAPLHDIVAYLFSFAKLGNCPACFEFPLSPNPLRGDWGGTEGIGKWLKVIKIAFNIQLKFHDMLFFFFKLYWGIVEEQNLSEQYNIWYTYTVYTVEGFPPSN